MAEKSKILIIGATGYIGKYIVEASATAGHPTFALVRESTTTTASDHTTKAKLIKSFTDLGVTLIYGDLYNHESLLKAVKQVDVVISTVGNEQVADQVNIIAAIKQAGNIKRFLPSEFTIDPDKNHGVPEAQLAFGLKAQIRRAIEVEGIPYTFVPSNAFAGFFLATLTQPGATGPPPPRDKVFILGDGNVKVVFNEEHDIGNYTVRTVDDPRTLNKVVYIRPPKNSLTFNELVAVWENIIGKTLEKEYIPEEKLLKDIEESPVPINIYLGIQHAAFIKGDTTNFEIEPSFGAEASELYPDINYTTVEEYLQQFA